MEGPTPLYEYKCPNCGTREEIPRAVDMRDAPAECFWCDHEMKRVPTAATVKFKGAGFHVTDYPGK